MNEGEISGGQSQEENKVFFSSSDLDASASAHSMFGESTATMPTAQPTEAINTVNTGAKAPKKSVLGGRSRSDAIKSSAAQAHPFVPNPNAPDFFNDAMRDLTPTPEPPKAPINKKPIVIGIIILLLLAVAGISAAVLLKGGSGSGGDSGQSKLAKEFRENLGEQLSEIDLQAFEDTVAYLYNGKYDIEEVISKKGIGESLSNGIGQLSKVKKLFEDYDTKGFNAEQKSKCEEVIKAVDEKLPAYEKIYDGYKDIYNAFHDKSPSAIAKLRDNSNPTISENYKKLSAAIATDSSLMRQFEEEDCDGSNSQFCQNLSAQLAENSKALYDTSLVTAILHSYNDNRILSRDDQVSDKISSLVMALEVKK